MNVDLEARIAALTTKVTTVNMDVLNQAMQTKINVPESLPPTKKKSKYRNKKVEIDGLKFDSQKEANRWFVLLAMQAQGEIENLHRQVRFKCVVNDHKICDYVADFVYMKDGLRVVEDVKSEVTKKLP
ncbi:MAG: DUF1064 domain-containing protein, partial [Hyphomicrobiaceae bacterium]